ncbi:MAG: enoyl-CoA hydratase [Alphaproteobacteria bacterium]|nr:enoyl-CoA hydratase [Alphaproteobacteria bacterium]
MSEDTILYEVRDGLAHVTLNRPDAANAFDLDFVRAFHRVMIDCDKNRAVRAVLLTGAGKMFSAGGDLKFFLQAGDRVASVLAEMTTSLHTAIAVMNRMDAPVVVAVNGMAAGGGMSLALTGEVVIAAESARLTMAYTAGGLSPDGSSTWFLPRLVGFRRAKELALTNRMLNAAEAMEAGIVDRVVPDSKLMAEAEKQARAFAEGPTGAYGAVKRLMIESFQNGLETQMELESRAIAARAASADGREGVGAFAEKRKPTFTGE